jgi:glycosyltransferase involved in cell wall biosynthesis
LTEGEPPAAAAHPRVSIGLPVRNGAKYVARAIETLLAQDFPDFELIIADNCSNDDTYEVCRRYLSDPRVRLHRHPRNVGAPGNFAYVLSQARGEYFFFAAADDRWQPDFISALLPALERTRDAGVAIGGIQRLRESGVPFDVVRYGPKDDPSNMAPWEVAVRIARGAPLTLVIYGLFRTAYLRRAFVGFPDIHGGDRLFACLVALSTRLVYVDRVVQIRQVADAPLQVRYADEPDSMFGHRPLDAWHPVIFAMPYLLRSPLIPPHRKAVVPLLVLFFALGHHGRVGTYNIFYVVTLRLLGQRRQLALRRALRRAFVREA